MSLGVDVIPFKTCSFDCIYCQLGRTTCKTTQRSSFVNVSDVVADLKLALPGVNASYVTFSGSGEPTLYLELGRLINAVKELTSVPVAVLTNGSLLSYPEVQRELLDADLVIPSLDAASQDIFEKVNRPCPELRIRDVISGIEAFSSHFKGKLWIEVMLVKDVNDSEAELARIASALENVKAEKIQLNTVERPPAEPLARPLSRDEMERAKSRFGERAQIIAATPAIATPSGEAASETLEGRNIKAKYGEILSLLRRRPCTSEDITNGLGLNPNEVSKLLGALMELGLVKISRSAHGKAYFHRGSVE